MLGADGEPGDSRQGSDHEGQAEAFERHLVESEVLRVLRRQVKLSDLHLEKPLATVWRIDWDHGRPVRSLS